MAHEDPEIQNMDALAANIDAKALVAFLFGALLGALLGYLIPVRGGRQRIRFIATPPPPPEVVVLPAPPPAQIVVAQQPQEVQVVQPPPPATAHTRGYGDGGALLGGLLLLGLLGALFAGADGKKKE